MSETALTILDEVPPAFRPRQPFDSACNSCDLSLLLGPAARAHY